MAAPVAGLAGVFAWDGGETGSAGGPCIGTKKWCFRPASRSSRYWSNVWCRVAANAAILFSNDSSLARQAGASWVLWLRIQVILWPTSDWTAWQKCPMSSTQGCAGVECGGMPNPNGDCGCAAFGGCGGGVVPCANAQAPVKSTMILAAAILFMETGPGVLRPYGNSVFCPDQGRTAGCRPCQGLLRR